MSDAAPFREVVSSSWATGWRLGSMKTAPTIWTLKLSCGHTAKRTSRSDTIRAPTKVRCEECKAVEERKRQDEGASQRRAFVKGKGQTVSNLVGASTSLRLYPSGILFTPFDPRPEDIRIEDVAHGLACINRFGGHLAEPYSVAQHCLIVSELCPEKPLEAHLHEVAEALSGLGDVCGPTKRHPSIRGPVKDLEHRIERAAAQAFGLHEGFASDPCVKAADLLAYAWEDRDLRGSTDDDAWVAPLRAKVPARRLVPMSWREARDAFLHRFDRLMSQRSVR